MINQEIIEAINQSGFQLFITATGAASSLIGEYLREPGRSKSLIGFYAPYHEEELKSFLGREPEKAVSEDTARKMAVKSYERAVACGAENPLGVGVTASIPTKNQREGRETKFCISIHSNRVTFSCRYNFSKPPTREEAELAICQVVLDEITGMLGLQHGLFHSYTTIRCYNRHFADGITYLPLINEVVPIHLTGEHLVNSWDNLVLYPGSFSRIHTAHEEIIKQAKTLTGIQPILEVSLKNADKGSLDFATIRERHNSILSKNYPAMFTVAPTFVDKVKLLTKPGRKLIFIVGLDTFVRLLNCQKYTPYYSQKDLINFFRINGVKFMVFGRKIESQVLDLDGEVKELLTHWEETKDFDVPISSTEIKKNEKE